MKHPEDLSYLEMAYGLAEKGRGWASPNPLVGAVLVSGSRIVGYGFHERPEPQNSGDSARRSLPTSLAKVHALRCSYR